MTHLSDFSYIERSTLDVYITAYLIYSIWKNDRFKCLRPSKFFAGELRSIITVIMFIMMTTQAVVDFYSTYIKYTEGFMMLPTGSIVQKPYAFWSPENQKPIQPMDYLQCVTFAFHTSVFFLMQCFWNYLSNSVAKRSFMGSFEFKFYILWALGSVAMFPVLQWRWSYDELMSEIVPQLAYGGEVLITAFLGIRSNFRFKRIIAYSMRTKSSTSTAIVNRLSYFKEMNIILTCVLFIYGACFVILCADGLTDGKTINTNKFACDLLIANVNMCIIVLWLLFISIFHPRRNLSTPQNSAISRSGQESEFQSKNDVELTQNSRPLSQRITNFIQNNNVINGGGSAYGSEKYQQQSSPVSSQPHDGYGNGVFMRPMSPVNVDYPPSMGTEAAPLTSAAAATSVYQRNMSIEDPYSSQSVVFSMVDPPPPPRPSAPENQQTRFPTPTTDMSYHTTTATGAVEYPMHNVGLRDQHDARSEFDVSDYHDDTTTTQPGMSTTHGAAAAAREQQQQPPRMVTDWLYQSPERKQ